MDAKTTLQNGDRHKVNVEEYLISYCHVNFVAE